MKYFIASCVALSFLLFSAPAVAEHTFKFDGPVELVRPGKEPRGQSLGIAWSGSVFGVVYDSYWWDKKKSGSFFMIVDKDGNKVFGPVKLSKKQHSADPKIVWAGDAFAVLHCAGKKMGKQWALNYYLARFNEKGKKLSENKLDGIPEDINYPIYSKMFWTGKDIGIFYLAKLPVTNRSFTMSFCKADSQGLPGKSVQIYDYVHFNFDVAWDGRRYVYVGTSTTEWETGTETSAATLMVLDTDGNVSARKTFTGFALVDFYQGISVIPTHKKNVFLVAIAIVRPGNSVAPGSAHWIDLYTTQLKVKDGKFFRFSPKNVTQSLTDSWSFPTLLRDGKNYYFTALLGTAGSSFAFARMNARGKVTSKPLEFQRPRPVCGCLPPYPVWAGKECGVVFVYGGVQFNVIRP